MASTLTAMPPRMSAEEWQTRCDLAAWWQGKTVRTAVWKAPVQGLRMVRRFNIDGDGQGDLEGHGGEHRAVFVYQIDSYRYWQSLLGRTDFTYGQFGENLTVDGLPEFMVLRLRPTPDAPALLRSYSLSGAPSADRYRISVKREPHGAAGAYIDTQVQVGDVLDASAPRWLHPEYR